MQTLSLTKRPGKIGKSIPVRTQHHGDDDVPALSIPFSGILLTDEELGVILQDEGAHDALFTSSRSKHPEPRFLGIEPLSISDKFKDSKVTFRPDNSEENIVLKPATIGSIFLFPMVGGLTELRCMISGAPDGTIDVMGLLNRKCTISILNGKLADRSDGQEDLPLGPGGNPEPTEEELAAAEAEEAEATESAMGRKIGRMEAKKKARGRPPRERKDIDG